MKSGVDNNCYSPTVGKQSILNSAVSGSCFFKHCEPILPQSAYACGLCIMPGLSQKKCINFESRQRFQHILHLIVQRSYVLEAKNHWRPRFLIFMTTSFVNNFRKKFSAANEHFRHLSLTFLPALLPRNRFLRNLASPSSLALILTSGLSTASGVLKILKSI